MPSGRYHLGATEILGRGLNNAYDAVTVMRPEWTRVRGEQSLARGLDPVVIDGRGAVVSGTPATSESSSIQVYVDDVNIGGFDALRTIDVNIIKDIYFFDPLKAVNRWGGRNPHGAILIVT